MKRSKGHFSGSSTTSVLVTMTDAPMLTNNLPPWFIPWFWCSCQPYHTCSTVCLDSLLKETDCFSQRKSQGFSSSVGRLPWGCHSKDRTRPIVASPALHHPNQPLVLRQPLCAPHHAAYFWHNAMKTPVLQAAKQPSHYFKHFEPKPQKYNYNLRAMGASDPGQMLGGTNTNSSLQRQKKCGCIYKDHSLGQIL